MRRTAMPMCVTLAFALLAVISGCTINVTASGDFHPAHPGVLTVATAEIPVPGLWEGTPANITGGFEYELAREIATKLGLHSVDVVIVPFDQIVAGDLGGADLAISDLTKTSAREQHLDFTGVYLAATPAVLVRAGESVSDLFTARQRSWAVQENTTLEAFLENTVRPDTNPTLTDSDHATIQAVQDNQVDAGLLDLPVAAAAADASDNRLDIVGQFDTDDSLSAAMVNGASGIDAVSSAIRALIADATVNDLAQRWLNLDISGTSADQIPLIRTTN